MGWPNCGGSRPAIVLISGDGMSKRSRSFQGDNRACDTGRQFRVLGQRLSPTGLEVGFDTDEDRAFENGLARSVRTAANAFSRSLINAFGSTGITRSAIGIGWTISGGEMAMGAATRGGRTNNDDAIGDIGLKTELHDGPPAVGF